MTLFPFNCAYLGSNRSGADVVRITGDSGNPFSLPGDSGSVILEEATGSPVALLFAGDNLSTTACELGPLCQRLRAWPV